MAFSLNHIERRCLNNVLTLWHDTYPLLSESYHVIYQCPSLGAWIDLIAFIKSCKHLGFFLDSKGRLLMLGNSTTLHMLSCTVREYKFFHSGLCPNT